jgi:spore coat protein U-like protein
VSKALRRMTAAGIAAALGAAGAPASAGQTTGTLPVSVTVFTGCSLQTRPLTFDAAAVSGNNPIDATTTITVKCTPNTNFTVDIDNGLNANGKSSNRQMKSESGGLLAYDIYRDSPRTSVWGTGQLKNVTGNSGAGAPLDILIYGRVPNATKVVAGDYKDTLVVSLNF